MNHKSINFQAVFARVLPGVHTKVISLPTSLESCASVRVQCTGILCHKEVSVFIDSLPAFKIINVVNTPVLRNNIASNYFLTNKET